MWKQVDYIEIKEMWFLFRLIIMNIVCPPTTLWFDGWLVVASECIIHHPIDYLGLTNITRSDHADSEFLYVIL